MNQKKKLIIKTESCRFFNLFFSFSPGLSMPYSDDRFLYPKKKGNSLPHLCKIFLCSKRRVQFFTLLFVATPPTETYFCIFVLRGTRAQFIPTILDWFSWILELKNFSTPFGVYFQLQMFCSFLFRFQPVKFQGKLPKVRLDHTMTILWSH